MKVSFPVLFSPSRDSQLRRVALILWRSICSMRLECLEMTMPFFHLLARAVLAAGLFCASPLLAAKPAAVVELFTSQGCSSCPPADALLEKLADKPGLVALTFAVDYWDYLGWRDTLASPQNSMRQRSYAKERGDRQVYTPQMVVNGERHLVGSDERALAALLEEPHEFSANVDIRGADDLFEIDVDGALPAGEKMATVYVLFIDPKVTVDVSRGENTGREITYRNVVRHIQAIGMWEGGKAHFRLPKAEQAKTGASNCVVLIQVDNNDGPGVILGADFF